MTGWWWLIPALLVTEAASIWLVLYLMVWRRRPRP